MKRIILIILAINLCLLAFSGCNKSSENYAFFSSYMLNSQDRNDPNDDVIEEMLLPNEALFAYAITKTETDTIQTVYVWHNLLRRELRLDIMQLYDAVPDKDNDITIKIDGEIIKINNKVIEFTPSSELSFAVLRAILPIESQVNARSFRRIFREMFIRLETVEPLGDYEVIAIQTIAQNGLLLGNSDFGDIKLVTSLDEVAELQSSQ